MKRLQGWGYGQCWMRSGVTRRGLCAGRIVSVVQSIKVVQITWLSRMRLERERKWSRIYENEVMRGTVPAMLNEGMSESLHVSNAMSTLHVTCAQLATTKCIRCDSNRLHMQARSAALSTAQGSYRINAIVSLTRPLKNLHAIASIHPQANINSTQLLAIVLRLAHLRFQRLLTTLIFPIRTYHALTNSPPSSPRTDTNTTDPRYHPH